MDISTNVSTDFAIELEIDAHELVEEAAWKVQEIIDERIEPLVQRIMHLEKLAGMAHDEHGTPFDPEAKAEAEAARVMEEMADAAEERRAGVSKWSVMHSVVECAAEYIKLGWTEDELREAWEATEGLSADELSQVIIAAASLVRLGLVEREAQA